MLKGVREQEERLQFDEGTAFGLACCIRIIKHNINNSEDGTGGRRRKVRDDLIRRCGSVTPPDLFEMIRPAAPAVKDLPGLLAFCFYIFFLTG